MKGGDYYISTHRAALNMAYQEFTEEFGKVTPTLKILGKVRGRELDNERDGFGVGDVLPIMAFLVTQCSSYRQRDVFLPL